MALIQANSRPFQEEQSSRVLSSKKVKPGTGGLLQSAVPTRGFDASTAAESSAIVTIYSTAFLLVASGIKLTQLRCV